MALNETQIDRLMELYNSIGPIQPCFAGDKSLDETADLIQRRVTLCINDTR